jgi:SAM-dependent methyltransferase
MLARDSTPSNSARALVSLFAYTGSKVPLMADLFFVDPYLVGVYDCWHAREVREDYDFYLPFILDAGAALDVGCGTGTLLWEARDAGHTGRLCGLDPATGMLERARKRSDIEWVLGDLASLAWRDEFDLIVMTGHAFQTVVTDDELENFMSAVHATLRAGGRFAFETRNPRARAWERWTPEHQVSTRGPDGSEVLIRTEVVAPFDGRTLTFEHTFTGSHAILPKVSTSCLRFTDSEELANLLRGAGLRIVAQYGDFGRAPLRPYSPEIITVAAK